MNMKWFWPDDQPRIHAVISDIRPPLGDEKFAEMHLSFNHRHDFEGAMVLRVLPSEAQFHRIGDIYAAHFKHDRRKCNESLSCFWPDHEPRISVDVTEIGKPDLGGTVEMRWGVKHESLETELVFRIQEKAAANYRVGDIYYAHFKLVSEQPLP